MKIIMHILNYFIGFSTFAAMFSVLISATIMRFYIIGKIEKRLGEKVKFTTPSARVTPVFGCVVEFVPYVIIKYLISRFYKKDTPRIQRYYFEQIGLEKAGYNIEQAPSSEIFLPFFMMSCGFWMIFGLLLLYFKIV